MEKSKDIDLTAFKAQKKSFCERFVDAIFNEIDMPARRIFSNAFTDGGYTPNIIDAQHWAVKILEGSRFSPIEQKEDFDSILEIFVKFKIPYMEGELSLGEAKSKAVKYAEKRFKDSVQLLMYDQPPNSPEWHAAHIYHLCETMDSELDYYLKERQKLEELAGNVDDYYISTDGDEREKERRIPFLTLLDLGVKIGFLYRDAWWKQNHEEAAIKYYEQAKGRKKGSNIGGDSTAKKFAQLKRDLLGYFPLAYLEKGILFLGAPIAVVSRTIREIALRDRPDDFVGPNGKPLSETWFLNTLEDFQADGEFGEAIERAVKEA